MSITPLINRDKPIPIMCKCNMSNYRFIDLSVIYSCSFCTRDSANVKGCELLILGNVVGLEGSAGEICAVGVEMVILWVENGDQVVGDGSVLEGRWC